MEKVIDSYISSYNSAGNQRLCTLIAILVINIFLFVFQIIFVFQINLDIKKILFSSLLAIGAILFSIFSKKLLLDLSRIHISKYEILLEEEVYIKEWKRLQRKGATSPVFNSNLEEYQSYFFIVAQCLSFGLNLASHMALGA